ncbi:MAG: bifunctional metallophosphatase/5'-nucleotidase [Deltaproteobacteria bacterium]|nr:bifunctional metallophosphatase/5'-nucleotidase [Deltaproteobacteria bacterium]
MRSISLLSLCLLFLVMLWTTSCSTLSSRDNRQPRVAAPDPNELILVATSDFHAALGRAEGLASVLRSLKAQYGEQMLHLDGGDLFQGSLEGNLSKGKSIVDFFNAVGLDAAAIGNHDLDFGPATIGRISVKGGEDGMGNIKARVRQGRFKWLSANIVRTSKARCRQHHGAQIEHCNALGQRTVFEPHAIFQRAGRKVCVIGVTSFGTPAITRPEFIKGVHFEELRPVVEAEAKHLREKEACDLVLLTAHAGLLCNPDPTKSEHPHLDGHCKLEGDRAEMLRLLRELPEGTLDAVVAGHTHMLAQEAVHGTPVLEAGTGAKSVGVLHLSGAHDTGLRARYEAFMTVPETASVPDITATLKPYRDSASEIRARPSGSATAPFVKNYGAENALANLIADSIRLMASEVAGADFALINAGGIRGEQLPAGSLTYADVFNVLPFDNSLTVVNMRGAELRRLLEIALSGGHGVGGISGLRVKRQAAAPGQRGSWDRDLDGDGKKEDWERNLIVEITDDAGTPLDDEKYYKVATMDFLVSGGDHEAVVYNDIPAKRKQAFPDIWERDILSDYLKKHPDVNPKDYYSPARPRVTNIAPR